MCGGVDLLKSTNEYIVPAKLAPAPRVRSMDLGQKHADLGEHIALDRHFDAGLVLRINESESGLLRADHLSRHKWPGGLVNQDPDG